MQETRCFPTTRRDHYWIELNEITHDIVRGKLRLKNASAGVSVTGDGQRESRQEGPPDRRLGFQAMDWTMLPYE